MNKVQFSVANLTITVSGDACINKDELFVPQPYNLNIGYSVKESDAQLSQEEVAITLNESTETPIAEKQDSVIDVRANFSAELLPEYNKQFGIFGNKGIINSFILSELEKRGVSVLHACAVIHPETKHVVIGVGGSGSGKSVLVSNALRDGWQLVATEHVLVNADGRIFAGNTYDNITPLAVDFIKNDLPEAQVFDEKVMTEPIGSKVLADFAPYKFNEPFQEMNGNFSIAVMKFGDDLFKDGVKVENTDFILRVMQHVASEKISSPIVVNKDILSSELFLGSPKERTDTIQYLLNNSLDTCILGGSYEDIRQWLQRKAQR